MRMGKSNHYKVGDIIGRHIMRTGMDSGLSRNTVTELFEQIHQQTEAAIDQTYQSLSEDFPISLFDSVAVAMTDRLRHLKWAIPES